MTEEFYEEVLDDERDSVVAKEEEDDDDDNEIVYDTTEAYKDDYEYDEVHGKKQKILNRLNSTVLDKEEMDEIFNDE